MTSGAATTTATLQEVSVLSVVNDEGRLVVTIEQPQRLAACRACGSLATVKNRDRLELGDLPAFGQPVALLRPAPLVLSCCVVPAGQLHAPNRTRGERRLVAR